VNDGREDSDRDAGGCGVSDDTLNIAEIFDEGGNLKFRYGRVLATDGSRWIRDGRFEAFHPNGQIASEGGYRDGREHGPWRDYHIDGSLAAEGNYEFGQEVGEWKYYDAR
jgi:antitoxin component YwqK of YwqJK toxin-antitoxin module